MKPETIDRLIKEYPTVFNIEKVRRSWIGFSVDEGWLEIVEELAQKLENYNKSLPEQDHIFCTCLKEKFASLRMYTGPVLPQLNQEIGELVAEAERKSYKTCEVCGEPGVARSGAWIRCLCETHAEGNPPLSILKEVGGAQAVLEYFKDKTVKPNDKEYEIVNRVQERLARFLPSPSKMNAMGMLESMKAIDLAKWLYEQEKVLTDEND